MRFRSRILTGLCATVAPIALVQAAGMSVAEQKAFVDHYCMSCHNPDDLRGDMLITDLDLANPHTNIAHRQKVRNKSVPPKIVAPA